MSPKRAVIRRLVSLAVLASLFFARLAIAGYVCPMDWVYGPADQIKLSSIDCLNSGDDQFALCANASSDEARWAGNNGHPPEGDAPPLTATQYPQPILAASGAPLQRLTSSTVVSEPVYLKTARLRL